MPFHRQTLVAVRDFEGIAGGADALTRHFRALSDQTETPAIEWQVRV